MYTAYIDGGARGNPGPAGIGIVLLKNNKIIHEISQYIGRSTNNVAEYTALLFLLDYCKNKSIMSLYVYSDSELLVRQINKQYQVRHNLLKPIYDECQKHIEKMNEFKIEHIRREKNKRADALANEGMDDHLRGKEAKPLP